MPELRILGGGAVKGLVNALAPQFAAATGFEVGGEFSAVGAMAEKLRAGIPTDLTILTSGLISELADEGKVIGSSARAVGTVHTGIARRNADAPFPASDGETLRAAYLAADAIYVPDLQQSTAGIHIAKVLARLGIADEVKSRLRIFPNGATAMRELAASHDQRAIGCTQVTEILMTPGITLIGPLPKQFELATVYSAALCVNALHPREAERFLALLTDEASLNQRIKVGFA
jgi:molybdate transport system substrate-binding protein